MKRIIIIISYVSLALFSLFSLQPKANAIVSTGTKKWSYFTGDFIHSSPAIDLNGTVYVAGFRYIYAINSDGSKKWTYDTGYYSNLSTSSPVVGPNGTIYIGFTTLYSGAKYGRIYAFYPDNGSVKWIFPNPNDDSIMRDIDFSPAIDQNGILYIFDGENAYAINPDGTLKWKKPFGKLPLSSPSIGLDGTIYIGTKSYTSTSYKSSGYYVATLSAFNPDNGSEVWSYTLKEGEEIKYSPTIGPDGTIYVVSDAEENYYLNAINQDGTLKWYKNYGFRISSQPVIDTDGTIYVTSKDGYLYAIDTSGKEKWKTKQLGDYIETSPAIGSDGLLYITAYSEYYDTEMEDEPIITGCLHAIDNGTVKWSWCGSDSEMYSSPNIAPDGTIYFGSDDCNLYAITSSSKGLSNSAWPKFHHDSRNTGYIKLPNIATPIDPTNENKKIYIEANLANNEDANKIDVKIDNSTIELPEDAINNNDIDISNLPKKIQSLNKIIKTNMKILTQLSIQASIKLNIKNLILPKNPIFYKYVNGRWIDLRDNTACDNCNFAYTKNADGTYNISFTIADGGVLDADEDINSIIKDPVVIGTANTTPEPSTTSTSYSSGGCTTSNSTSAGLLFILLAGLGLAARRKLKN